MNGDERTEQKDPKEEPAPDKEEDTPSSEDTQELSGSEVEENAEEEEDEGPVSEHAGIISEMDRLMCTYYGDEVANDLLNLVEGDDVLLVGCEDGYIISSLALAGHKVVALDFNPSHLRKVKKILRGWDGIDVIKLEGRSFPFDAESFDTVLVSLFAHHATNPARVFDEASRVLRPGGMTILADLVKHEETWMMDELADVWLGFTEEEVSNWMEDANLVEIVAHKTGACCSGPEFEEHGASVDILLMTSKKM